jgi:N-methylhydantoinase A
VHGAQLARLAGISTMLVPAAPGVLSAMGFLLADVKQVFSRTLVGLIGALDLDRYNQELAALAMDATDWLERERIAEHDRSIEASLELRYQGQAYELSIPGSVTMSEEDWTGAAEAFHVEHERRYGYAQPFSDVEVVTLRMTAVGRVPTPELPRLPDEGPDASHATGSTNSVYFDHVWLDTPVYERTFLKSGNRFDGPALVVQDDSTTVIHPGQRVQVDDLLNLIAAIETTEDLHGN